MATLYAYSPNGTQATLSYSVIGFTQSLQQNGWCKLPNGLILQWGYFSGGGRNGYTVSLSIRYTNTHYCCVLTGYKTTYDDFPALVGVLSLSSFNYYAGTGVAGCRFISIGK